jgi:hypothetical protein
VGFSCHEGDCEKIHIRESLKIQSPFSLMEKDGMRALESSAITLTLDLSAIAEVQYVLNAANAGTQSTYYLHPCRHPRGRGDY